MRIPLIFFLLVIPFKSYTDQPPKEKQFTVCQFVFSNSDLDHERYSEVNLQKAIDSLNYHKIISTYPVLTRETEKILFKLYKEQNSKRAFQTLFLSHIRLVHSLVKSFRHTTNNNHDDFIQEGMISLLNAIKSFDPQKGARLSSYAKATISNRLKGYEGKNDRQITIKWSNKRRKIYYLLIEKIKATFGNISEDWITEFAEEHPEFLIVEIRYVLLFITRNDHLSLEAPIYSDDDNGTFTLSDVIPSNEIGIEGKVLHERDLQKIYNWITTAVRKMNRSNRYEVIINDRLFSQDPRTLRDIAQQFNVNGETIRSEESQILKMIKEHFESYDVNKYLPYTGKYSVLH